MLQQQNSNKSPGPDNLHPRFFGKLAEVLSVPLCPTGKIMLDKWTQVSDEGQSVDYIYMDFKKAFDTVPHNKLLHKVEAYGINGNILGCLIKAFLTDRSQRVVIKGSSSIKQNILSGVPLGSICGAISLLTLIKLIESISLLQCKR